MRNALRDGSGRALTLNRSTITFRGPPAGPSIDDAMPVHPVAAGRDDGEIRARVAIPSASAPERWAQTDRLGNPIPSYPNARLAIQCLEPVPLRFCRRKVLISSSRARTPAIACGAIS